MLMSSSLTVAQVSLSSLSIDEQIALNLRFSHPAN